MSTVGSADSSQQPIEVETFVDGHAVDQVLGITADHYQHWLHSWLNELAPQFSPIDAYELTMPKFNSSTPTTGSSPSPQTCFLLQR
jgi:hypothetical protein